MAHPLQFCDGEWHKIQVWKRNNIVQIQVDENPSYESVPLGAQTFANIYDPLYVGGLPPGTVTNPFIFLKNIKL